MIGRLTALRWWGLAGTGLLAVGAYLAGAGPGVAPASRAEALWGTHWGFRIGLAAYLVGLVLLGWAWWALGAQLRAGADEARAGLRWVLTTGALWAAPLLVAPSLGSRDVYAYACQGAVWLDGHDPYATGAAGGGCPWLAAVPPLWHDTPAPYGPVALLGSAVAAGAARLLGTELVVAVAVLRLVALAGALLVAGFGPRLARACGVDPAAAAWLGLVTPLVAVHVVAGAHNDALVAGALVAGLALAVRGRVTGAGLALGLAVAVKVTALAALPFGLLLVARAAGMRWNLRRPALLAGVAAGSFAVVTIATGLGTGWVDALTDTGALVQWSSVPTGLGMAAGYALWGLGAPGAFDTAVTVGRVAGLVALVAISAGLLVRAWRHRDDTGVVVAAAGGVLAAVAVLGPVLYPWYAVVPLAVLAASLRWPQARRWLAVATLVLTALVLPSGLGVPVLTKLPGAVAVALGVLVLAVLLIRRRWRSRRAPRVPAR